MTISDEDIARLREAVAVLESFDAACVDRIPRLLEEISRLRTVSKPLRWTSEAPMARGFYWLREGVGADVRPAVVEWAPHVNGEMCVWMAGHDADFTLASISQGAMWAGPIAEPESENK